MFASFAAICSHRVARQCLYFLEAASSRVKAGCRRWTAPACASCIRHGRGGIRSLCRGWLAAFGSRLFAATQLQDILEVFVGQLASLLLEAGAPLLRVLQGLRESFLLVLQALLLRLQLLNVGQQVHGRDLGRVRRAAARGAGSCARAGRSFRSGGGLRIGALPGQRSGGPSRFAVGTRLRIIPAFGTAAAGGHGNRSGGGSGTPATEPEALRVMGRAMCTSIGRRPLCG